MERIIAKDGYEMKLEYVSRIVFENNIPVFSTSQLLDTPYNRKELDKVIEPFVSENKIKKRFLILESKKTEIIKYSHL